MKPTAWATLANLAQQGFSFITLIAIARYLPPSDFALVSIAMIFLLFAQKIIQESIVYLVIKDNASDGDNVYKSACFALALGVACALYAFSVLIAHFIDSAWIAGLSQVVEVLLLIVFVEAVVAVPIGILRREMKYKELALRTMFAASLSSLAGLGAAIAGLGLWALVIQQIVLAVVSSIFLIYFSRWVPCLPKLYAITIAVRDSRGMISAAGLNVIVNRIDILIAPIALSPHLVGCYSIAKRVSRAVLDLLVAGALHVATTRYSVAGVKPEPRKVIQDCSIVLFFTLPIFAAIASGADNLVQTVLGKDWGDATVPLVYLSWSGLLVILFQFIANYLIVNGDWKIVSTLNGITAVVFALALFLRAVESAVGLSLLALVVSFANFVFLSFIFSRSNSIKFIDWIPVLRKILIYVLVVPLVSYFNLDNDYYGLAWTGVLSLSSYYLVSYLLDNEFTHTMLKKVIKRMV